MSSTTILHKGEFSSRIIELGINQKKIITPTYFPSISSAVTRSQLFSLIRLYTDKNYPRLLVSAYDLHKEKDENLQSITKILESFQKRNFLFLDSGTFESHWLYDKQWNYAKYSKMIKKVKCDLFTSFDVIPSLDTTEEDILQDIQKYSEQSMSLQQNNQCMTIIHGNSFEQLCHIISNLLGSGKHPVLAIPERECGRTLSDKIKTVQKIRKIVNDYDDSILIHILGCGNPVSIALFSFAGADMFDSVDWSRWTIDPSSLQFTDISHIEILNCKCKACASKKFGIPSRVFMHNMLFYQDYLQELRQSIDQNAPKKLLDKYLGEQASSQIINFFKG